MKLDRCTTIELIELAASQHRSSDGSVVPPPTGADLERRRRFH